MRSMVFRCAAFVPLALFGAIAAPFPALAGGNLSLLDDDASARIGCFANRLLPSGAGPADLDRCYRLNQQESTYMGKMKQQFCSNPQAFCQTLREGPLVNSSGHTYSQDEKDARLRELADRNSQFVSPRCEPGNPSMDLGSLKGSAVSNDAHFAAAMRNAWGCKAENQKTIVVNSGSALNGGTSSVRLVDVYDCDPALMPFACSDSYSAKSNMGFTDKTTKELSQDANAMMLEMQGAGFTKKDGRCEVSMSGAFSLGEAESFGLDGSRFPVPEQGEMLEHFRARISDARQLKSLDSAKSQVDQASDSAFNMTSDFLGRGTSGGDNNKKSTAHEQQFDLAARAALTPERYAALDNSFEAAKEGVLAYLDHLDPPVPDEVKARVRNTKPFDYRLLFKDPAHLSKAEKEQLATFDHTCNDPKSGNQGKDRDSYGDYQAENLPGDHPGDPNMVIVCPKMLLKLDSGNPRGLVAIIGHELGHSIDPCDLASFATPVSSIGDAAVGGKPPKECSAATQGPSDAAERAKVLGFVNRVQDGFTSCINKPLPSDPKNSPVRQGPADLTQQLYQELKKEHCWNATAQNECSWAPYFPGGARSHCVLNYEGSSLAPGCRKSAAILKQLQDKTGPGSQLDQSNEAFADMISAQALPYAMNSPRLAPDQLNSPKYGATERAADLMTAVAPMCGMDAPTNDEHPDWGYRISVFAGSSTIRKQVGCDPTAEATPSPAFPTAGCQNQLGTLKP